MAKITLIGWEQWMESNGDSIFKDIVLPPGYDKQLVTDSILYRCSEFEVIYANPDFLKQATTHFFKVKYRVLQKWLEAYLSEYNPIENTDRYEDWTDTGKHDNTGKDIMNGSASNTASALGGSTNTHDVTTDNSGTYKPESQDTLSTSDQSSSSITNNNTTDHTDSGNTESKHTGHIHGNIGTMTVEQLLRGAFGIAEQFDIYKKVADLYCKEFCIGVYV